MIDCRIAGLYVCLDAGGRTARQAEPYRVPPRPASPDLTVSSDPKLVMRDNPWIKDWDTAEYMGTGASFAYQLPRFSGFQIHAAAIELEGRAYLFSGPCGVGKSTHSENWVRHFGAMIINDDKPVLRRLEDGWTAFGTPWSGKHDLSSPVGVPMGALIFLRQGSENQITGLSPAEALPLLLSQTYRMIPRRNAEQMLELADQFLQEIPVWRLICRNEDDAAVLARKRLCGDEK